MNRSPAERRLRTEQELLEAIVSGSPEQRALVDEVFSRRYQQIRRHAERFFSRSQDCVTKEELADLVVDRVLGAFHDGLRSLQQVKSFPSWLSTVVRNACVDVWRGHSGKRILRVQLKLNDTTGGGDGERLDVPVPDGGSPGTKGLRLEVETRVTGKLAYVPPHDLELEPDELRYLAEQRGVTVEDTRKAIFRELGPVHEQLLQRQAAFKTATEERLGGLAMELLRAQRERQQADPRRCADSEQCRQLERRLQRLERQRSRLLGERVKSRPKMWRVPAEQLAAFLQPGFEQLDRGAQKALRDAVNKRLTRFRAAVLDR
jgi:DNA-directed RNA polymerase specialized sigma24 family protein